MKYIFLSLCLFGLLACGPSKRLNNGNPTHNRCEVADNTPKGVALNDIRFAGWGKKEWADNEYIRAVRKYIDDYNSGKIKDEYLDKYKQYIQGKFVIADIQPYLIGGALIYIIFYDNPKHTFSAHVYSDVDEKTRGVSNYECRGLKNENLDLKFSQEDIRQFLKECPEHRLW
ncbi:MAG: hypothetical protein J6K33_10435 [Alistipes sp.]|nr:hypothetical protein [Alistipes sp.]